ncbi:hypothetical protein LCGC14_0102690 [marine sediment metagenome]|uniref:Uncharacterized protein n=1 Tax=marine sediment metagenome TaxID=412755 RepID=A0A0F9YEF1_9ZZZZ
MYYFAKMKIQIKRIDIAPKGAFYTIISNLDKSL